MFSIYRKWFVYAIDNRGQQIRQLCWKHSATELRIFLKEKHIEINIENTGHIFFWISVHEIEKYQSLKSESSFPRGYVNEFSVIVELINHPKSSTKFWNEKYIDIDILHGIVYGKGNYFIKTDFKNTI